MCKIKRINRNRFVCKCCHSHRHLVWLFCIYSLRFAICIANIFRCVLLWLFVPAKPPNKLTIVLLFFWCPSSSTSSVRNIFLHSVCACVLCVDRVQPLHWMRCVCVFIFLPTVRKFIFICRWFITDDCIYIAEHDGMLAKRGDFYYHLYYSVHVHDCNVIISVISVYFVCYFVFACACVYACTICSPHRSTHTHSDLPFY